MVNTDNQRGASHQGEPRFGRMRRNKSKQRQKSFQMRMPIINKCLIRRVEKLEQRQRQELQKLNRVTYEEFQIILDLMVRLEDPIEREAFMREPPKSKGEVAKLKGSDKFKYGCASSKGWRVQWETNPPRQKSEAS